MKTAWIAVIAGVILAGELYSLQSLEVSTEKNGVIAVHLVQEGETLTLFHVNSIYDAPVEEILRVKNGSLELEEVRTPSYGVKEYYGIAEGITKRKWKEFTFRNSSDRGFSLKIGGRTVPEVETHRDQPVSLRQVRFYPLRRLFTSWRCGSDKGGS
ncbi:MAG: hypothetical protein PHS17_09420 [Desulfobacterales bacterium]|nr:hypothetical protein [Desulfobacterales bacterium]